MHVHSIHPQLQLVSLNILTDLALPVKSPGIEALVIQNRQSFIHPEELAAAQNPAQNRHSRFQIPRLEGIWLPSMRSFRDNFPSDSLLSPSQFCEVVLNTSPWSITPWSTSLEVHLLCDCQVMAQSPCVEFLDALKTIRSGKVARINLCSVSRYLRVPTHLFSSRLKNNL